MDIFLTIISMATGALITWIVSRYYYQKAGRELKEEALELRKLNMLMLRSMEKAGLAKFSRDINGNIIGMTIELSAKIEGKSQTPDVEIGIK